MLTQSELKELLSYDPDTGIFTWLPCNKPHWNARYSGTQAGTVNDNGYVVISVRGKRYRAHRLAWLYIYGSMPLKDIDHINRDKSDNRISNLRDVSRSENLKNRKVVSESGITGVFKRKDCRSYIAYYIDDNGAKISKTLPTLEQAVEFRDKAERSLKTYLKGVA